MKRIAPILTLLLLAACASGPPSFRRGERGDTIQVIEVKNLSGVSLKIPAIYFGDALGAGKDIKAEKLDLRLLTRAALLSYLNARQYKATLEGTPAAPAKYELHAAVTQFNLDALRATGRITLGMHMMLVKTEAQEVVVETDQAEDFQLLDQAPDAAGSLGGQRFIEDRLKAFAEQLAASLLQKAGL